MEIEMEWTQWKLKSWQKSGFYATYCFLQFSADETSVLCSQLIKKDEQMKEMEERYKLYLYKATSVSHLCFILKTINLQNAKWGATIKWTNFVPMLPFISMFYGILQHLWGREWQKIYWNEMHWQEVV